MENETLAHFAPPSIYDAYRSAESEAECYYNGTDFLEVKILLIGVFAALLAVTSFFFNAFFTCVFVLNASLRRSPLYYFGVLAALDTIMAVNYLALMAVPVYMDHFGWLWLYFIFLGYFRPMLTLSNCAIFASVLMILLATVERLLQTTRSEKLASLRKFLEQRRPQVCLCLVVIAFGYKLCTYFEIDYIENENCPDWTRFEVIPAEIARNPTYNFWWMFVTRNLVDRIIPFFALVFTNILIIRTLKREHLRAKHYTPIPPRKQSQIQQNHLPYHEQQQQQQQQQQRHLHEKQQSGRRSVRYAVPTVAAAAHPTKKNSTSATAAATPPPATVAAETDSLYSRESLRNTVRRKSRRASSRIRRVWSRHGSGSQEDSVNKKNLRDATRALLAIVTMYLMSQTLQVLITFWEAFWKVTLENEFKHFYSFVNDIMSILTLLSSVFRFPVYCAISKPISAASSQTLCRLFARRRAVVAETAVAKKVSAIRPIVVMPADRSHTKLLNNGSELRLSCAEKSSAVSANLPPGYCKDVVDICAAPTAQTCGDSRKSSVTTVGHSCYRKCAQHSPLLSTSDTLTDSNDATTRVASQCYRSCCEECARDITRPYHSRASQPAYVVTSLATPEESTVSAPQNASSDTGAIGADEERAPGFVIRRTWDNGGAVVL